MLTAERRIMKRRKGFLVPEWVKVRARNEALDIRAMGVFALAVLNPIWDSLEPEPDPEPVETQPKRPYIPHEHPRRRRRR